MLPCVVSLLPNCPTSQDTAIKNFKTFQEIYTKHKNWLAYPRDMGALHPVFFYMFQCNVHCFKISSFVFGIMCCVNHECNNAFNNVINFFIEDQSRWSPECSSPMPSFAAPLSKPTGTFVIYPERGFDKLAKLRLMW